jgi:hypothetical protein
MRHGRKSANVRLDGHKAQVVADVETGLVAAGDVAAGSANDEEGSLELVQESAANTGLEIEEALTDCAHGSGENRERLRRRVSPCRPRFRRRVRGENSVSRVKCP